MESPPKRMTRARAAAKAGEPSGPKPTKIVTAATKAKTTRTAAAAAAAPSTATVTKTTATKRKTRSDELDGDHTGDESDHPAKLVTKAPRARGRPRKVLAPEPAGTELEAPAAAARATRGRPTKKAAPEPAAREEAPKPLRRTRAKKTQVEDEQAAAAAAAAEPAKKPATRGRPAATTKSTVKKTVTFEEPDKENVAPATAKGKAAAAKSADTTISGLRAKPVRRAAATTAARGTRTAAKPSAAKGHAAEEAPKPLSPKKVTQVARSMRPEDIESDDELALTVGTPLKPFNRSPVRPSANLCLPAISHSNEAESTEEDKTTQPSEPTATIILGSPVRRPAPSPYKDSLKSPARRVPVPVLKLGASATKPEDAPAQPSFKSSLLQSPAKRPQSVVKTLFPSSSSRLDNPQSPLKLSLLASPAKRPFSPFKPASPVKAPEAAPVSDSPAMKPVLLATPVPEIPIEQPQEQEVDEVDEVEMVFQEVQTEAAPASPTGTRLKFPGRLSAVLPRHADPALKDTMLALPEVADIEDELEAPPSAEDVGDPMIIDEPEAHVAGISSASTTPPHSPPKHVTGVFGLREKELEPANDSDSESDDELGSSPPAHGAVPATPCPATSTRTLRTRMSQTPASRRTSGFGFTPLANQLSNWAAPSPLKKPAASKTPKASGLIGTTEDKAHSPAGRPSLPLNETPQRSTFFEDEMSVRPDPAGESMADTTVEASPSPGIELDGFNDMLITKEDVALAAEANEMSLFESSQVEELVDGEPADDTISDASGEYGDENAVPIDPALQPADHTAVPPVTPRRVLNREFHTVSKVPLKPADESTPRPVKKRGHSISRLPVQRPSYGLTRNATVISYSPMKAGKEEHPFGAPETQDRQERATSAPPVTPTKSEVGWSTTGTPARTPRRDVDPALLRGAVVFVDVHTSEGADASGIFVELLTAMGAKCVKSWPWNPSSPPSQDGPATSRIGITHVVYKDGGKRTLEKVRETGGVVQCVGVSWVLDCERENEWLDEAPYYIDTSSVPRGGARRRKSMEPKALANMNGMLVPTPMRNANSGVPSRELQSAPATPVNRRDSGLWMRTPEDEADNNGGSRLDGDDLEWDASMLTPVPVTPAPEAIHRFALEVSPETPSTDMDDDEGDESVADHQEAMAARTCPQPKRTKARYSELGMGVLAREKDEGVLQRLMAARRKSLQFAPKIGSPLAKAWN